MIQRIFKLCYNISEIQIRKLYKILMRLCIFWFVFLCLLHYLSARPLWLDENFILKNIKILQYSQLFGPLQHAQAFPRVYLAAVKFFSEKLDYSVLSLRFLPLICMLFAFLVWGKIYKMMLSHKWQFLLALFSFSSSYYLSYYASELKQYSMDVLVMGIYCLYLIYQEKFLNTDPTKKSIYATFLLPLTIMFSYSSFFIFWIVMFNFIGIARKNHRYLTIFLGYSFLCVLFSVFVFAFDIKFGLSDKGIYSYWRDYFICTDSPYCFVKSFTEGLRRLSVWWFTNGRFFRRAATLTIPFFVFSMFTYGIKSLRISGFKYVTFDCVGLIVFLELFILGMLKVFPFTGERITLFFAPLLFYLLVKGITWLKYNRFARICFVAYYVCFLAVCSVNSFLSYLKLYD